MLGESTRILEISSSGRNNDSATRTLSAELIAALKDGVGSQTVVHRDLSLGIPFVDEQWIEANFTSDEHRTPAHLEALAYSDELVAELRNADVLVIGAPLYNFSIPAPLKAWIDMIARARLTFQYTENGPVGLLEDKKAYLVVASGGVPIGSPMDFATPYLRHTLSFVGITDVDVIAADELNSEADESMRRARQSIAAVARLSAGPA